MKTMRICCYCILFLYTYAYPQTYEMRIGALNATTAAVQMRCTSVDGLPTAANYMCDLKMGIRWPKALGMNFSAPVTTYNMKKSGGETVSGEYEFQSYYADGTPFSFPADWVQNTWETLMTITVSAGAGLEAIEICPDGFSVSTDRNFNVDLADVKPTIIAGVVALPVELTTFTAVAKSRDVVLTWKTATETNNSGFEVQRKLTGEEWSKVGFVEGNGSSAVEHTYSLKDVVRTAAHYSYRLKQLDRDGRFECSAEVEVATTLGSNDYALGANYPNPFNPSTRFTFAVKNNEQVVVRVFNLLGQEVTTLFNGVATANTLYEMNFNAAGIASGTYFYMLKTSDRFEIKKMMLMK
jgi:Secretion system C-terminal sorting domain